jgi:hypothetical protein
LTIKNQINLQINIQSNKNVSTDYIPIT